MILFQNLSLESLSKKVIICGIAKDIGEGFYTTKQSVERVSSYLDDYRVIIYENNSLDNTKTLLKTWEESNPDFRILG